MGAEKQKPLSREARDVLMAAYASIDACGGRDSTESADFNRGYDVGLERALMELDRILNASDAPDERWIQEGWNRFLSAVKAQPQPPQEPSDEP